MYILYTHFLIVLFPTGGKIAGDIVYLGHYEKEEEWNEEKLNKAMVIINGCGQFYLLFSNDWST